MRTAAQALKAKAGVDGIYINSGGYFLLPFMYGEGGDLVDADAEKITVNSAENVTGIQTAQDLVKSGDAVKPDANDSYGTMMTLFKEGKVGMIINGPWEVANIPSDPKFGGFENLGVAPVPGRLGRAGRPRRWPQLRHLLRHGRGRRRTRPPRSSTSWPRAESEAFIADELGLLPGNAAAYDELGDNEKIAAWQSALEVAKPRPWIPEGGQFFGPLDEMATKVLIQGEDVQASLDETAKQYKSDVVPEYSGG